MVKHKANPVRVRLSIDGVNACLPTAQVTILRRFGADGVLHNDHVHDVSAVRALARRGWVIRSRGRFVLTPQGKSAQSALADYLAQKASALHPATAQVDWVAAGVPGSRPGTPDRRA